MTLERRLTLVAAVAVAVAVSGASAGLYFGVRDTLRDEVDTSLQHRLEALRRTQPWRHPADAWPPQTTSALADPLATEQPFGGTEVFVQEIGLRSTPQPVRLNGRQVRLPVTERDLAIAAGRAPDWLRDVRIDGEHLRMLTGHNRTGYAVQLVRPLDEVDSSLHRLSTILAAVSAAGLLLGALLGKLLARGALSPIRKLGQATRRVRATGDLGARVEVKGRDELAELAGDFNAMLGALEASSRSQRQLVADASHELRTPLTSLRTYLEYLRRSPDLPGPEREQILRQAIGQVGELTGLVSDLVELARGEEREIALEPVRLDLLAADAVARAEARAPAVRIETELEPCAVLGVPDLLLRAVGNLLDNAVKWSQPDGVVEVSVGRGRVRVRDHGPGIDEEDLPQVFERFYRSKQARSLPGSGLGLAIVRQVAQLHGGAAVAGNADGGGAILELDLRNALLRLPEPAPEQPALDRV